MKRIYFLTILFIINFEAYSQWIQKGETINHNDVSFGESLDLNSDGTQIIIGERFPESVVVYEFNGSTWIQKGSTLTGEDGSDDYGNIVVINDVGNIIAVGAPQSDLNGSSSGSLYLYSWNGNSWIQLGSRIDGNSSGDQFAKRAIGMSSDGLTIVVGSGLATGNASNSGHVRAFTWDTVTNDWSQKGSTLNGQFSNGVAGEFVSLSADGDTLVYSDLTNEGGFVFVYEWDDTSQDWMQKGTTILGEADEGWTGAQVRLSGDGNTVAYGAPLTDNETGLAKIYDFDGIDWVQRGAAILGDQELSRFGREVDLSEDGNLIFISGYAYDTEENGEILTDVGSGSIHEWNGNEWVQKGDTFYGVENNSRLGQLGTVISNDGSTIAYLQRENGLDGAYVFEFNSNLSVQDINHSKTPLVFPNPFKNNFNIRLQIQFEGTWLIYNELGQTLAQGQLQGLESEISTANLSSGFYVLQIKDKNNTTTTLKKIIKD